MGFLWDYPQRGNDSCVDRIAESKLGKEFAKSCNRQVLQFPIVTAGPALEFMEKLR